jgi:hypothetical protein
MAARVGLSSRMTDRMEAAKKPPAPARDQHRLAKPATSRRHQGNNAASSEDEDEDDESTLRAMSTLGQQERAHPGMNAAKLPVSMTNSKSPTATTMPAVRQLLQAVEHEMRSSVGRGDNSRLVVALESAKYELADAEHRRRADWTRVLALASQLQLPRSSTSTLLNPAAELAALAQRHLGMAVDWRDAPAAVDSNQDEDEGEDEDAAEDKTELAPQQSDEPAGAWTTDGTAALVEKELAALRSVKLPLSLTVAEPVKRSVQEPKPPKAGHAASSSPSTRSGRLKFQFPDADVTQWTDVEDGDESAKVDGNGLAGSGSRPAASVLLPRRRVSAAVPASASSLGVTPSITGAVPLRRRSFSMKRSPRKTLSDTASFRPPSASSSAPTPPVASSMRRKSTSVLDAKLVMAKRRTSLSRVAHLALSPGRPSTSASASASRWSSAASPVKAVAAAAASSQLVLRVRERKRDGVRELVLRKQPRGFLPVAWHWHDRHRGAQAVLDEYERVVKLGPHQHGVMLRQLRFVKAAMHEFPWAKTHLRELLARYTAQQLSKEALYPQLALLSTQVQSEVATRAVRAKTLAARKQRLTLTLTLATGVVNDVRATKFGRRGRPHATRLCYDPSDPLRLRWVRKGGERSDESLVVDELQVLEQEQALARDGASFDLKRVLKTGGSGEGDCACLLSLVSPGRALDLCVKTPLHREWLAMALREVAAFARQFRASGAVASPHRRIASGI